MGNPATEPGRLLPRSQGSPSTPPVAKSRNRCSVSSSADLLLHDRVEIELTSAALADGLADLRWRLRALVLAGARVIVIDVSDVDQLSSTAVGAMLGAHRVCRTRGGRVVLRNPSKRTLDLLRETGLWRVLGYEYAARARSSKATTGVPGQ